MDKESAVNIIYRIINSDIIDSELEEELKEICNRIENGDWED